MKIGTRIKPRSGKPRNVTVHGKNYVFSPTVDAAGDVHFVAEVKDADHAVTFMQHVDDYYAFGKDLEPEPTLSRKAPAPAPAAPAASEKVVEKTGTPYTPAIDAEAEALLAGTAATISRDIGGVSTMDVVRAAILLESQAARPRASVLVLLKSAVTMAEQAGVDKK